MNNKVNDHTKVELDILNSLHSNMLLIAKEEVYNSFYRKGHIEYE